MKELFINRHNLEDKEIDEVVTRVKALIINSNNEMLLGYSYNCYQFPGGHVEEGENISKALVREIKEETGMDIKQKELKPFMMLKYYSKNYLNKGKNRCNKLYYFVINTDCSVNLAETNYTDEEIDGNFELRYINVEDVEEVLIDNCNKYPKYKGITYEMLQAFSEYENRYRAF